MIGNWKSPRTDREIERERETETENVFKSKLYSTFKKKTKVRMMVVFFENNRTAAQPILQNDCALVHAFENALVKIQLII